MTSFCRYDQLSRDATVITAGDPELADMGNADPAYEDVIEAHQRRERAVRRPRGREAVATRLVRLDEVRPTREAFEGRELHGRVEVPGNNGSAVPKRDALPGGRELGPPHRPAAGAE